MAAGFLHRVHGNLLSPPHLPVGIVTLIVPAGLITLGIVRLVWRLRNITGARNLTALIRVSLRHISLSGALRISIPLAETRLPWVSLLSLRIILLGIGVLVCALIWGCSRLSSGVPVLLEPGLVSDSGLASRNLRCLVNALCRLIARLLLISGLRLVPDLLLRLLIPLLRRITLESSPAGIASCRIPLLRPVALALIMIIIVLIHLCFPFRRILTSGNPLA